MSSAIETFCQTLARSGLLAPEEFRRLLHLWKKQPPEEGGELQRFLGWLLSHHYLTPFQVERLAGGHTGHFYLGRYKLLDRIGDGTMARVYKAVCPDGHLFALKVLPPSRAQDPRWRTLFENEVSEAGRFRHPHVVRTFQTGKADGMYYLVMEYLDGETLDEVLKRRGQLPHPEAARLVHQALQGLQHIHELGSVHCNLEPAHLMLVRSPTSGKEDTTLDATVKILDAGLGRTLFGAQTQAAGVRVVDRGEAQLLGQVDDLAPERAGGGEGDIRADIYSLGCILYHCLAGHPPFPGGTVFDKLIRHATEAPRPLTEINSEVPEGLWRVVERMMAREPQERYPDPASAAQALIEFLPPEAPHSPIPIAFPVEAPPAMPRVRPSGAAGGVQTPALITRPWVAAAAGSALVLFIGIAILSWIWTRDAGTPDSEDDKVARATSPPGQTEKVALSVKPPPSANEPPPLRATRTEQPPAKREVKPSERKDPAKALPDKPKPPEDRKPPPAPAPSRLPVPAETDQMAAQAMIREVFKSDYARRGTADLHALARKLLRQGIDTKDDFTARFVLLREARDLAAQTSDIELALQALEHLSREYDVDTHKCKAALFALAAKTALNSAGHKHLAEKVLEAIPEAVLANDYGTALQMTALADSAARRAGLRPLQRKTESLAREVKEIRAESERLAGLGVNIRQVDFSGDALDAQTRLGMGQFLCFFKGDWTRGLPLLAASGAEPESVVAAEDLLPSADAASQVRRGDAWWMLAETRQGTPHRQLQRRSAYWYQQALPGLSGLTRTRVEQRIKLAMDE